MQLFAKVLQRLMDKLHTSIVCVEAVQNLGVEYKEGKYLLVFTQCVIQTGVVFQAQVPAKPEQGGLCVDRSRDIFFYTHVRNLLPLNTELSGIVYRSC